MNAILKAMESLSDEKLPDKIPKSISSGDTLGDYIGFILHHKAYTIGMIGIYRKFLQLPVISYN